MTTSLPQRMAAVQARINAAAHAASRDPSDITLIAVSKTWPAETVVAAYYAGLRQFGENRSDEFAAKQAEVARLLGNAPPPTWHFIGTLQSRQTGPIAAHADLFHALDRLKIARRLSRQAGEHGRTLPTFLEVNVSGEATKAGFDARRWEEDETQRRALCAATEEIISLPHLELRGLMTMAPWGEADSLIRDVFTRTRALRDWLQTAVPTANLPCLSMGMTDDFELAIAAGATHIRVGRALFGERSQ